MKLTVASLVAFLLSLTQARLPFQVNTQTPCDLISTGCSGAFSVNRSLIKSYAGNLFQLARSGGGGGTLNVGVLGSGLVDLSGVGGFCGSGSTGNNAGTGANGCTFAGIYDQTVNANTLTPFSVNIAWATDANGYPEVKPTGVTGAWLEKTAPTGVPSGTVDKSIIGVFNDKLRDSLSGWWGLAGVDSPCHAFVIGVFGPEQAYWQMQGNAVTTDTAGCTGNASGVYLPNYSIHVGGGGGYGGTFNGIGTIVEVGVYTAGTTSATIAVNGGLTASVNVGSIVSDSDIHLGVGPGRANDGDNEIKGWYEGEIVSKAMTTAEANAVAQNASTFYNITTSSGCTSGQTPVDLVGASNINAVLGLRVLNPKYLGPLATIQRASDSAFQDLFAVGCDIDTATAAAFCASTTCAVSLLYNQMVGSNVVPQQMATNAISTDLWNRTPPTTYTAPPLSLNCLSSHPCISATGTTAFNLAQQILTNMMASPPLSMFVAMENTASGEAFNLGGPIVGFCGTNTFCYTDTGSNHVNVSATDGSFYGFTVVLPTSSTATVYRESSSASGSGLSNATSPAQITFPASGSCCAWTGKWLEVVTMNTALSSGSVGTLAAAAKSYWGY
jgi:hypothetical protein